ncbi:glycosyl transferase [Vibrio breoganii]|uniref:WecB/TagA/CpsF family glycosyltransferase n=1 Tax=Vibrio breoganii TaxID=553239 RepID=UPI000C81CB04|nr:WecB/TagA/CpsF family glycosyltransferase [Vibrio breoganii]PMP07279.1 glycosyl transferase [Vibrio breoganii]
MKTITINGVNIYAPRSRKELVDYALDEHKILVAVNAEKIHNATDETRSIINRNLGYPDGYGAIAALRYKGVDDAVKIPGCELWLDILDLYSDKKSFYFIGGKKETLTKTLDAIIFRYPDINILGSRDGYFDSVEESNLINDIAIKKPDVVFVALGSPKQELFMEKASQKHKALYQGLGGSFDVFVGNVNRAPDIWVKCNLEWLYRLIQEPKRFGRQVKLASYFLKLKLKLFK